MRPWLHPRLPATGCRPAAAPGSLALQAAPDALVGPLQCRWRLRGLDIDWRSAAGSTIHGAVPAPGRYQLEIQAQHSDGEWNQHCLNLQLEVLPFFWQTRRFALLLAVSGMLLLATLIWYLARRRLAVRMASLERQVLLTDERARIARDMHDEVGARLSQLAIMQDLYAREHALPGPAESQMQELARTTRRVIASLDEVVWAVNPRHDTLASLAGYLSQLATEYLASVALSCQLDAPLAWPAHTVRAPVRHHLALALREALQNVLKHSGARQVRLELRCEVEEFILRLTDDGRGLGTQAPGPGQDGLANIADRLAAIGGSARIRSPATGGTEVELRVPLIGTS